MTNKQFERILRLVRAASPPWLDHEAVAQEIWIAIWQGKVPLTPLTIRSRVIDAIRATRLPKSLGDLPEPEAPPKEKLEARDEVDHIMSQANLDPASQEALYLAFYTGLSPPEAARKLLTSLPEYKRLLSSTLAKLRNIERSNNGRPE